METNMQNAKTSPKEAYESTRASLELLSSMLSRQYLSTGNNSSASHYDINAASTTTEEDDANFIVGEDVTLEQINTLKELREAVRIEYKKLEELEALLAQRDERIENLHRELERYRNLVLVSSPYGQYTKHRPQGDF